MNEHKVTCGVRLDVLEGVVAGIEADLKAEGVHHRLVVSGSGDWRFLDLVPREAGKLQVRAGPGQGWSWSWAGLEGWAPVWRQPQASPHAGLTGSVHCEPSPH